jgi:hypothetical protein
MAGADCQPAGRLPRAICSTGGDCLSHAWQRKRYSKRVPRVACAECSARAGGRDVRGPLGSAAHHDRKRRGARRARPAVGVRVDGATGLRDQFRSELLFEFLRAGAGHHSSAFGSAGSSAGGECAHAAEHAGGAHCESRTCGCVGGGFRRTDLLRGRQRDLLGLGVVAGDLMLLAAGASLSSARGVARPRRGIPVFVWRSAIFVRGVLDGGRDLRCRLLRRIGLGLCTRRLTLRAAAAGHDRHADRRGHAGRLGASKFGGGGSTRSPHVDRRRHGGRGSFDSLDRGGAHPGRDVDRVRRHRTGSGRGCGCGSRDAPGRDST